MKPILEKFIGDYYIGFYELVYSGGFPVAYVPIGNLRVVVGCDSFLRARGPYENS
jgi:hypothetical protein